MTEMNVCPVSMRGSQDGNVLKALSSAQALRKNVDKGGLQMREEDKACEEAPKNDRREQK